ncbi:MAG: hypothetical protein ACLFVU_09305 [Phycisphaerae bacterium]
MTPGPPDPVHEGPDEHDEDLLDETTPCSRHCRNCGGTVYEDADKCPWCGHWLVGGPHEAWTGKKWWYILLAAAGVIILIWWLLFGGL